MSQPSKPCPLDISSEEWALLSKAESAVVREYESKDGSRFARLIACGEHSEMEDRASRSEIVVLPVGVTVIATQAIPVSELVPPSDKELS